MLISDLVFIFRALPVFLFLYYIVPIKQRPMMLLVFNILFYYLNAGTYTLILVAAVIINHLLSKSVSEKKKSAFIVSMILNVALLVSFKLLNIVPVCGTLSSMGLMPAGVRNIILPLGISFYTFKLISYQADLYKGDIQRGSFIRMAAYVTDFSQILSGPISRYSDNVIDLPAKEPVGKCISHISDGLTYFCAGIFIKIVIADNLARMWNQIGTIGYENASTLLAWMGVFIFSAQLFCDFWGYSLMASGIGVMMGRRFIVNFNEPYRAVGVTDFYRRWHVTLGNFFKDYVYIPLGGSRVKMPRLILNLSVVWLLTGFWHGVTLNYLIWAAALLILIIWEKCVLSRNKKLYAVFGRIHVWLFIPLTWVVFALDDMNDLKNYFMRLFGMRLPVSVIDPNDAVHILESGWIYVLLAIICLIPGIRKLFDDKRKSPVFALLLFVMFWISIYGIAVNASNPFMYMGF